MCESNYSLEWGWQCCKVFWAPGALAALVAPSPRYRGANVCTPTKTINFISIAQLGDINEQVDALLSRFFDQASPVLVP